MGEAEIFWDRTEVTADSLGRRRLVRVTDGDTPYIQMSIRMLSIETLARARCKLGPIDCLDPIAKAPINRDLGEYLHSKLATAKAGALQ